MNSTYSPITTSLSVRTTSVDDRKAVFRRLFQLGFSRRCNVADDADEQEKAWPWHNSPVVNVYDDRYIGLGTGGTLPCLTSAQFFQTYGPLQPDDGGNSCSAEPAAKPAAPANPPNFIVDTHGDETLSRVVQELCFSHGLEWCGTGKGFWRDAGAKPFPNFSVVRQEFKGNKANTMTNTIHSPGWIDGLPTYSASTQFGEIVRILSTPIAPPKPPAPVGPTIHGYKAEYTKYYGTIKIGCAQVCVGMLKDVEAILRKGNNILASVPQ